MGANPGRKMRVAEFAMAALPQHVDTDYDWQYEEARWDSDEQPMLLPGVADHLAVSRTLKPQFMELVADIVVKAGYCPEEDRAELVAALMAQPERTRTHIGDLGFTWRLKTEACATQKLGDHKVNQNPGRIGDYFAVKFVPTTVEGVVSLRQAALDSSMTSRKCEFSKPSDEGYRSHKSHHVVTNGTASQTFEVLISHADMEAVNDLTHKLKDVERSMADATLALSKAFTIPDRSRNKLSARMSGVGGDVNALRTAINNAVAFETGIDDLALPEFQRGQPDMSALKLGRATTRRVLSNMSDIHVGQLQGIIGQLTMASAWPHRFNAANTSRELVKT